MKTSEKVYWIKSGIGLIAGFLSYTLQNIIGLEGTLVFMLGALIYLAISDVLGNFMKLDRNHALKIGIGAFVFIWILVWTLLYTIMKTAQ